MRVSFGTVEQLEQMKEDGVRLDNIEVTNEIEVDEIEMIALKLSFIDKSELLNILELLRDFFGEHDENSGNHYKFLIQAKMESALLELLVDAIEKTKSFYLDKIDNASHAAEMYRHMDTLKDKYTKRIEVCNEVFEAWEGE